MAAGSHEGLRGEALEGVHAAGSEARERSLPVRGRTAHPAVPDARQTREAWQQGYHSVRPLFPRENTRDLNRIECKPYCVSSPGSYDKFLLHLLDCQIFLRFINDHQDQIGSVRISSASQEETR